MQNVLDQRMGNRKLIWSGLMIGILKSTGTTGYLVLANFMVTLNEMLSVHVKSSQFIPVDGLCDTNAPVYHLVDIV